MSCGPSTNVAIGYIGDGWSLRLPPSLGRSGTVSRGDGQPMISPSNPLRIIRLTEQSNWE